MAMVKLYGLTSLNDVRKPPQEIQLGEFLEEEEADVADAGTAREVAWRLLRLSIQCTHYGIGAAVYVIERDGVPPEPHVIILNEEEARQASLTSITISVDGLFLFLSFNACDMYEMFWHPAQPPIVSRRFEEVAVELSKKFPNKEIHFDFFGTQRPCAKYLVVVDDQPLHSDDFAVVKRWVNSWADWEYQVGAVTYKNLDEAMTAAKRAVEEAFKQAISGRQARVMKIKYELADGGDSRESPLLKEVGEDV